jgi:two-component system phosphate regulon sensor histidine kinase PhoR
MKTTSPILRKLLLGSLLLILVAVVALDSLLSRYVAERETHNAELRLRSEAAILRGETGALQPAELAGWTRSAAARAGCRLTMIDRTGRVLADSEHDAATMENHAQRPEVAKALAGEVGSEVRRSATLGVNQLYVAVPAAHGGETPVALRLAIPMEQVDRATAEVRERILRVSLVAALLALGVAYLASRGLSRRIAEVKTFAEGLVNERLSATLPPGSDDELGDLARSLNRMAKRVREMLEQLRLEATRREAILAGMVEGVLAVDHELCVTFCNQAFAKAVGARHPVPERLPVLELVRDPDFIEMLSAVVVSGEVMRRRMPLAAAEGHTFEVQAAPLSLKSGRGALAILHDVTHLERRARPADFVANFLTNAHAAGCDPGIRETLLNGRSKTSNNRDSWSHQDPRPRLNNIASDCCRCRS